jgi:hypothetical protein
LATLVALERLVFTQKYFTTPVYAINMQIISTTDTSGQEFDRTTALPTNLTFGLRLFLLNFAVFAVKRFASVFENLGLGFRHPNTFSMVKAVALVTAHEKIIWI